MTPNDFVFASDSFNRFKILTNLLSVLWLENLTRILESERESQDSFQVLPFHYVEISKLLIDQ